MGLGNKPCCPFCGKHLANIRQHIRVVHKQIRFPCTICKKQMTTKAELKKHYAKSHYSMCGEPVLESRTINPNIEPDQGGLYNHSSLQKDFSDEQLIAQYLGKQQFSMPDSEHNELIIKPDLDHLITGQSQPHHLQLKSEPVPGLQARDQVIRSQERADQSLSRDDHVMSMNQNLARNHQLLRDSEQLVLRNDQVQQREELSRHQHLPQQNHHLVLKHELESGQGGVLLARSSGGNYSNSSLEKYNSSNHIISSNQQFWSEGPPLVSEAHQSVQIQPIKLKQNL